MDNIRTNPGKHSKRALSGILMMIQASVAFSLMALFVKFACHSLPSNEVVFFRSFIGLLIILGMIRRKRTSLFGHQRFWLFMRGVTGFLALVLYFYAIKNMALGTAVIINYMAPIFAAVLAVLFLREHLSLSLFGMILLAFFGLYLLVGNKLREWNIVAWAGMLSAVFAAIAFVSIRAIKHRESPLTVIFYFTGISTVGSLFLLPIGFRWPDLWTWAAIAGLGIFSFYGQLWLTISLRRARTSLITPFSYLTPLLSFIYGLFIFDEKLTLKSCAGAGLTIISGILISY
ncbi:MAG: DMT family transporter, partial [Candidatus Omnitrophica bacterium]|nr:DMT family transporter [Candidatus Omnitrophota bacterium]